MALEILSKYVDELKSPFITVDNSNDTITFKIMSRPALEGGTGVQHVDLIKAAKHVIEVFNKEHPSRDNAMTITKLDEAIMWQQKRTDTRTRLGLEGTYEQEGK